MGEQVDARFIWGCSSVGRAPALQAGGQEFESLHLHLIMSRSGYSKNIRERKKRSFLSAQMQSSETCYQLRTLKTAYRQKYPIN